MTRKKTPKITKFGDKKMLSYVTCYIFLILIGISFCYLGARSIYIIFRLRNVSMSPIKMVRYSDELLDSYAFACSIESVDWRDLDYTATVSTTHGACIKFNSNHSWMDRIFPFLSRIPKSKKILDVLKHMIAPVRRLLSLPIKIRITNEPIEKFLWPDNELTVEDVAKIKQTEYKKLTTWMLNANVKIGDGETRTYFAANEIAIFKENLSIDVKPKAYFCIGTDGVIVYADRLLVKGTNRCEDWEYPGPDACLLIFARKNIPKERQKNIVQFYESMTVFEKLLREYEITPDKTKRTALDVKIARLLKDMEGPAKSLDVEYLHEKMKSKYEECK